MLKPRVPFRPEGLPAVCVTGFATLVLALLGWPIPALLGLGLTLFTGHFFRDPEVVTPDGEGLAVAPADGRVVAVTVKPDPFSGERRAYVAIFMNVVNVHVNRAPVAATLTERAYHPGAFLNASLDKASEKNERLALRFEDGEGGSWTTVQIAGLVARRIVCQAEVGDSLARGERFGMIMFGSRVDVYLPEGYEPALQVGDRTTAGLTVLARRSSSA